jgi:asparagine synthase (glutamine-hydrolysing)
MCGISGFIDANAGIADLQAMQQILHHRGPDARGHYFENGVGLAHNRLSIIDLSHGGDQPFYFEQLVLVYNGEIYNYKEIRKELIAAGYNFTTASDTEVLIKGFHRWGPGVLEKIIGMFAFAMFDKKANQLYLCRDRLGVKPLYYLCNDRSIFFASELKALWKWTNLDDISNEGLAEYLTFGYTLGDNTFFKNIKSIPPGHYLTFQDGTRSVKKYWDASDYLQDPLSGIPEAQLTDQLEDLLVSSFKYRMLSDVPVGIFLSGGIDSTALVALLSKHYGKLNTFTIGFDDQQFDETPYAREIAKLFQTNHTEQILSAADAKKRLHEFYKIYDEPFFDSSGIPTSLVSEIAQKNGMKVVLSSEGGDELFAGYPSYSRYYEIGKRIFGYPAAIRKPMGSAIGFLNKRIKPKLHEKKIARLSQFLQTHDWIDFYKNCISDIRHTSVKEYLAFDLPVNANSLSTHLRSGERHPIELFMLWDLKYLMPNDFLVKVDRATMYHGVESREPFLDHRLVEFALRLPLTYKLRDGQTKYLLRKVLERYVPAKYFDRPKMGFSIPLFTWFRDDLDSLFEEKLTKESFSPAWPQINYEWISRELKLYHHGKSKNKDLNIVMMWKFLGLMLWHDEYKKS